LNFIAKGLGMAISITTALQLIEEHIAPLGSEVVPIESALNRVSVKEIIATHDLPRFDNSAMDGFAVRVEDAGDEVEIQHTTYAGDSQGEVVEKKRALKIMTGAPTPSGCEVIVPIEQVTPINETTIKLPNTLKEGDFIRRAGEDIASGASVVKRGEQLNAYHIASLTSQGITHIEVTKTPTVAVFSTGDELKAHFESVASHQLYNSNTPMFLARLQTLGCTVHFVRSAADTLEALKDTITSTLGVDIIITSGGVSVGEKDLTREAFLDLGMEALFYKVEMKPGKPVAVGKLGRTVVVNLPGNPLAAMVNFELYIRAILYKLLGKRDFHHTTLPLPLVESFKHKGGRPTVLLGSMNAQGFSILKNQKPGMVTPMSKANALLLLKPETRELSEGEMVNVIPLYGENTTRNRCELFN
jgi:molybdopterin molybdotransferase